MSARDTGPARDSAATDIAAANERDELVAALRWALPLAEVVIENHRQRRLAYGLRCGTRRIGLYDSEVAEIEKARAALAKAEGRQS